MSILCDLFILIIQLNRIIIISKTMKKEIRQIFVSKDGRLIKKRRSVFISSFFEVALSRAIERNKIASSNWKVELYSRFN